MAAIMRGVAMIGQAFSVSVINQPMPTLLNATDAIVRINASAICGSDLHFYHQPLGSPEQPFLLGHEAIGYVTEVGEGVQSVSVGDYVVVPDNADDGHWGYEPERPWSFGAGQGLGGMQAEYVRVPFADLTLIPVPVNASTPKETLYDYLFVSDIFSTGWSGLDFAGFMPGDSVAIFGAGPVGLLAAYSAILRGASRVYSVDHVQSRLDLAESIGAIPINFNTSDPVDQILAMEPGGVTRAVDCVGFEAVDAQGHTNSSIVMRHLADVTSFKGGIGIIGVYSAGVADFDIGKTYRNGITVNGGIVLPLRKAAELVPLITAGKASPSFIVTRSISLDEAPEYYARFDNHEEIKVVIDFP
ncbi:GroES-like protein [Hypoxylon cercidicola]|nr:GroES-like protein [Hypoxylon cercidicola]